MKKLAVLLALCTVLAPLAYSQAASVASLSQVPVRVDLNKTITRVAPGTRADYTVTLKNPAGHPVPAPEDTLVEITSQMLGQPLKVTIPKGQTSAAFYITTTNASSVANVTATAKGLRQGSSLMLVRPAQRAPSGPMEPGRADRAPAALPPHVAVLRPEHPVILAHAGSSEEVVSDAVSSTGLPAPSAAPPEAPPTTGEPGATKLNIHVVPEEIYPAANGGWMTSVLLTALDNAGNIAPVLQNVHVLLTTHLGTVSPREILLARGADSSYGQEIVLTSSRDGEDLLRAVSTLGPAELRVTYQAALPARLGVLPPTQTVLNDGKTEVAIDICLYDAANGLTSYSDRDVNVTATSTRGTVEPSLLTIPKATSCAKAKVHSARDGESVISVKGPTSLAEGNATVKFLFPYMLILLAALGGFLGGLVKGYGKLATSQWWKHLLSSVGQAVIWGVLFWGLVVFGAVAAIPKTNIALSAISSTNELGALIIGVLGGYVGKRLLEREDGAGDRKARAASGKG